MRAVLVVQGLYPQDEWNFRSYGVRNHLEEGFMLRTREGNCVLLVKLTPIPDLSDGDSADTLHCVANNRTLANNRFARP